MGQKLDFSAGVPHNFFIYRSMAPKFHYKVFIDTNLAQDKENCRSMSKVKVKWAQSLSFQPVYLPHNFLFTARLRPNSTKRCAWTPAWIKINKIPGQGQRSSSNGPKTWFFSRCTAQPFHLAFSDLFVQFGRNRPVNEKVMRYAGPKIHWSHLTLTFDLDLKYSLS